MNLNLADIILNRKARGKFSTERNKISKGKFLKKLNMSTKLTNLIDVNVFYA